jgi:hypothetical protein
MVWTIYPFEQLMQNADQLIDVATAARILTLRPSTIRAMVRDRKLVPIRPAGARRLRFRLHDIERLAGLRSPTSDAVSAAEGEEQP